MCHPFIKNSHHPLVADIRFPDNDSIPAIVPACLYCLTHCKTLPEPSSVLEVDDPPTTLPPDARGCPAQRFHVAWATLISQPID
ncbi:hypothetical protein [Providencia sp. PROV131]|uniref:hypothetical protein n=1 Tax=Providencia sp. PROV131 TaxID=2949841 RepID=UPI00234AA157|nr:hypothetical protein [Providencia sp. PROV131]